MNNLADFSKCGHSIRNASYGGQAGFKEGILFNDEMWILKYPKSTKGMRGDCLLSYSSSPLSEYVGSHIYQILGVDVHETALGIRNGKLVVGCKDFCGIGENLLEVRTIINYVVGDFADEIDDFDSSMSSGIRADIDIILMHLDKNSIMQLDGMKERFWDQIIIDAYINNNDRNNGNWGIIRDSSGNDRLAPVFDNGASFNNKLEDSELQKQLNGSDFDKRMSNVISSFYRDDKRLFLGHLFKLNNPVFLKEIERIVPTIIQNQDRINEFIRSMPEEINGIQIMSSVKKQYFIRSLQARLNNVLIPKYREIINTEVKVGTEEETGAKKMDSF